LTLRARYRPVWAAGRTQSLVRFKKPASRFGPHHSTWVPVLCPCLFAGHLEPVSCLGRAVAFAPGLTRSCVVMLLRWVAPHPGSLHRTVYLRSFRNSSRYLALSGENLAFPGIVAVAAVRTWVMGTASLVVRGPLPGGDSMPFVSTMHPVRLRRLARHPPGDPGFPVTRALASGPLLRVVSPRQSLGRNNPVLAERVSMCLHRWLLGPRRRERCARRPDRASVIASFPGPHSLYTPTRLSSRRPAGPLTREVLYELMR